MITLCEPARKSPCLQCEHHRPDIDKEIFPACQECQKRILYDLSTGDPRIAKRHMRIMEQDQKRWDKIKDEPLFSGIQHEEVDQKLKKKSKEAGFGENYIAWIWDMYDRRKLSISRIAAITRLSAALIRTKLVEECMPLRKSGAPILKLKMRHCKNCGKEMERKRYENGGLESTSTYRKRKFCSRACADDARADKIQVTKRYCKTCGKEIIRGNYNGKQENPARYMRREYCSVQCSGVAKRKEIKNADSNETI